MTPKEIFLKDEKLANQLSAVTRSQWFRTALVWVRAQMMQTPNLTDEHLRGALLFEACLIDLAEDLPEDAEIPDAGRLEHDLDSARREPEVKPKKQPKTKQ